MKQEGFIMLTWIRYRLLMHNLRGEIALLVNDKKASPQKRNTEKMKTPVATACKACGSIV